MDHDILRNTPGFTGLLILYNSDQLNGQPLGDDAYAHDSDFGTSTFFFIEDTYMENGIDQSGGSKVVIRHSDIIDHYFAQHGIGQTFNQAWGPRAAEYYNNAFYYPGGGTAFTGPNGGSMLVHDNDFYNPGAPRYIGIGYYRPLYHWNAPFFGSTGRNAWDVNDPIIYVSGTCTTGTTATTVVDSTKKTG